MTWRERLLFWWRGCPPSVRAATHATVTLLCVAALCLAVHAVWALALWSSIDPNLLGAITLIALVWLFILFWEDVWFR